MVAGILGDCKKERRTRVVVISGMYIGNYCERDGRAWGGEQVNRIF